MGVRQSRPIVREKKKEYRVTMAPLVLRDKDYNQKMSFESIQNQVQKSFFEQEYKPDIPVQISKAPIIQEPLKHAATTQVPVIERKRIQIQPFPENIPPLSENIKPEQLERRRISIPLGLKNYNFFVCLFASLYHSLEYLETMRDSERIKKIMEGKKKIQNNLFDLVKTGNETFVNLQEKKNNLFAKLSQKQFKKVTEPEKVIEPEQAEQAEQLTEPEKVTETVQANEPVQAIEPVQAEQAEPVEEKLLAIPHMDYDKEDENIESNHLISLPSQTPDERDDNESIVDDDTESIRSSAIRVEILQKKQRSSRKNKLAFGNITEVDDRLFIETNQPVLETASSSSSTTSATAAALATAVNIKIEDVIEFVIKKENETENLEKFTEYKEIMKSWNDSIWSSLSASVLKKIATRFGVKPKGTKTELKRLVIEKLV